VDAMPRVARELGALAVGRLKHPGPAVKGNAVFTVGGVSGLMLQVTPSGARSWILRTMVGKVRREIGLGSFPAVSLANAREMAQVCKNEIRDGRDPVAQKREARAGLIAEQRRNITFAEAVNRYMASGKIAGFRNEKHRKQWQSTLDTYAIPEIGKMQVGAVSTQDVKRVLDPIWKEKSETASRLRGRIEKVLSSATDAGYRTGDNPASLNALKVWIDEQGLSGKGNHGAVQLKEAAAWFAALKQREGMAARALQFVSLTAARSGEVRGMTWGEVDIVGRLWTIPGIRMKAGKEHRVPLTPEAIAIVTSLPRLDGSSHVFAAPRGGPLSDMSLSAVMRRMQEAETAEGRLGWVDRTSGRPAVPHGLRSTFRDWVAELTEYPPEMAEVALAHTIGNKVEAAYRRGDMMEKRRQMMADWAAFLEGSKA